MITNIDPNLPEAASFEPNAVPPAVDTVVIGLGNDILSDDGVGLYIARRLRERLDPRRFAVEELTVGGVELVERLVGFRRAVVIDACRTGRRAPGTLTRHRPEEFMRSLRLASYHTIDFPSAIELVRRLGGRLPDEVTIFALEVIDVETVSERCTPDVEACIAPAAERIARFLEDPASWQDEPTVAE